MRDYLDKENVIIIRNYGSEIYNYMRSIEYIEIQSNLFDRHKINPEIRTKMVDWMVEVLSVYKCEQETFFLAVYIMDSYIFKTNVVLTTDDVHILGLTAMFVASKFEDVIPIRMNSLVSKIGHDLFNEYFFNLFLF
jgi:cyclin B